MTSANLLAQAMNWVPNLRMGKPVFYCNRNLKTQFDQLAINKSNAFYTSEAPFGRGFQSNFLGIPIKKVDAIVSTETALS